MIEIHALETNELPAALAPLSSILIACVRGGASVEFLSSITVEDANEYWAAAFERVVTGQQVLLVASSQGTIVGTVSLVRVRQRNQQHRAEISKLLVDPQARKQGIADLLMDSVESLAWSQGLTMLVLDTVTGSDASRVYERRGWTRAGDIPDYALDPYGQMCSTSYYWCRPSPRADKVLPIN